MPFPSLYLLVEGPDDQRFFQSEIIDRTIKQLYRTVHVITWTNEPRDDLVNLVSGIIRNEGHYIFLLDKDSAFVCLEAVRQYALQRCPNINSSRILIVIREIESWYLAGIDSSLATRFDLSIPADTSDLAKSRLEQVARTLKFASPADFMVEILKTFSITNARGRNASFDRLLNRYLFGAPSPPAP